jgi:predicted dehydrogenase
VLPKALSWTVPPRNFSSMVALFVGHYLDMLFSATGWPDSVLALGVNQFPEVTIMETGEVLTTSNPDEFVFVGTLPGGAVATAHFEGGKRNGSGVQIDFTGTEGDIRITNSSAFGGPGDDYESGRRASPPPNQVCSMPLTRDCQPVASIMHVLLRSAPPGGTTHLVREHGKLRARIFLLTGILLWAKLPTAMGYM